MATAVDIDALRCQLGRKIVEEDEATAAPLRGMAVTFGREEKPPMRGEPVSPSWHLTYFPAAALSRLSAGRPRTERSFGRRRRGERSRCRPRQS
jgi:hypothetical protein